MSPMCAPRIATTALVAVLAAGTPMVAGLGGGSVLAAARAGKGKQAAKNFAYRVSDCLESDRESSVRLVVGDGQVSFNHVLKMNCVAATRPGTVTVSHTRRARAIEVSVVLRTQVLSACECPIEIDGTLSALAPGTYRLSFVYDFQPDEATGVKPARQSLGTQEITIK
jgi:hypothetical protein